MTRRTVARDERAPLAPQTRTIICALCVVENVSPDGGLPKGWKPVPGGVHCPDCAPTRKVRQHG